jgi:prepilin-type N-terminal cleavage/methylation domain-containing protein
MRSLKTIPKGAKQIMTKRRDKQLRKNSNRRQTGFTLVEIMIVVSIIGVLMNIALPSFIHARDSGQARTCVSNLHNISLAKEQFAADNNALSTYTPVWSDLSPYIKVVGTPLCPTNGAVYEYNDLNTLPQCSYGGPAGLPHAIE